MRILQSLTQCQQMSATKQHQSRTLWNPLLAGHGGGYYGPNALNMGNTAKREPGNKYARDPANCARAWDLTLQILKAKGGLSG